MVEASEKSEIKALVVVGQSGAGKSYFCNSFFRTFYEGDTETTINGPE